MKKLRNGYLCEDLCKNSDTTRFQVWNVYIGHRECLRPHVKTVPRESVPDLTNMYIPSIKSVVPIICKIDIGKLSTVHFI